MLVSGLTGRREGFRREGFRHVGNRFDQHPPSEPARRRRAGVGRAAPPVLAVDRPFRAEAAQRTDSPRGRRGRLVQVQFDEPRAPRRLDDRIPRDLETICLKAMAKEPSRRYQTAAELADDLDRFLRGDPIHARPIGRFARCWKFCRRHWRVVLPSAAAIVALAAAGVVFALAEVSAADLRAANAQEQERLRQREVLVERLQRVRLRDRTNGWSTRAGELVRAAASIRRDEDLRDFAAAGLDGLDAHVIKQFPEFAASSVAFDARGRRLLLGGFDERSAHLYVLEKPDGAP